MEEANVLEAFFSFPPFKSVILQEISRRYGGPEVQNATANHKTQQNRKPSDVNFYLKRLAFVDERSRR